MARSSGLMSASLAAISHTAVVRPYPPPQNAGHSRYSKPYPWSLDFPENVSHHSYCLLLMFIPWAVCLGKNHYFASWVDTAEGRLRCELEKNGHLSCPGKQKDPAGGTTLWEKAEERRFSSSLSFGLRRRFWRDAEKRAFKSVQQCWQRPERAHN